MCSSFTCPREVSRRRRQTRISWYQEAQPRVWPGRAARALEELGTDLVFALLGSRAVCTHPCSVQRAGRGEQKRHRIRQLAGREGSSPLPSVAGSRLPSLLMHPAAPSSLPAAWLHPLLAAGPPDVGASAPTSSGSSVASCCRGTNLDSRRQQGWWLRAAAAADAATRSAWLCSCHFSGRITNFQGRGGGEQPFGRLLSSDSSARALKQTTGKRRLLLRICQPDAAWL